MASVRLPIVMTLVAFTSAAVLGAQSARSGDFARAQQANNAALRTYTWKSRTELKVKGETKKVTLEHVRFDIDGQLQKTRIGGTADDLPRGRRGGPIKQRIVAKKIEDFKEEMSALAALAASYGHLSHERLDAFAKGSTIGRDESLYPGTIRIDGRDVLMADDSMTVWIEPATYMTRHVEIRTRFEDDPVRLVADYRTVVNGPTYQARAVLRYPEDQIEVVVENFEFMRQNP